MCKYSIEDFKMGPFLKIKKVSENLVNWMESIFDGYEVVANQQIMR
ncbi:MAG: hypothetical protein OXE77_06305 [Flavobacteriaceae bacterium]|nr:hypothetical protein [Flavobacteriaceae bacterium]MCY4268314.1 hypothetical protein [Flavobacteriaceae bacterium]MCY4297817.1 hypothetical protein [Flavobacteriaceae bacterium]